MKCVCVFVEPSILITLPRPTEPARDQLITQEDILRLALDACDHVGVDSLAMDLAAFGITTKTRSTYLYSWTW